MPSAFLQWLYADAADGPQTGYEVSRNSDPMSPKFTRPRNSASGSVHYPLQGWKLFNLVVTYHNDAPEPVAGRPVAFEEVMRGFEHIHPRAQSIIRHGTDWKKWVLCDREPVEHWVDGRVALLGDAAHPMLQYFAQGACMAMEDAVCLGHMLATHPGRTEAALEAYRAQRLLRTARVSSCRAPSASTSTTPPVCTRCCATR